MTSHRVASATLVPLVALLAALPPPAAADPGPAAPSTMSLDQAIALALAHHPGMRTASALVDVARARVDEARASELPDGGISGQWNRSTGNSIPGTFFPTVGFASISGSPRGRGLGDDAWQSGTSLWASWNVTGLAQRMALVDAAVAAETGTEAASRAEQLEIEFEVSDAFLSVLAALEQVRAATASVDRARTFATVVKSLVAQNLRPGADAARVDADLALALTQLSRAEQARATSMARLAELVGLPGQNPSLDPGGLLRPVGNAGPPALASLTHPIVEERIAEANRARAFERVAHLDFLPRVDLVAALWARGSGYYPGGFTAAEGAFPDTPNWGAGVVISWPFFDLPILRARSRAAAALTVAADARRDEAVLGISSALAEAQALLDGARRVAHNTPVALAAAQVAEAQAQARYRASLSSILSVADAQRVLAQAELEDALARLEVRRAVLLVARAAGDLEPFFADARVGTGTR